jgi:hypothetical protein
MHDRRNGKGTLSRADASRYSGSWKHDKAHGYGVKVFGDGDVYTGEFVLGLFHGAGRYEHSNGEVYSGQYVRGSAQGKGSYSWPSGDLYEGEFFNSRRHGFGRQVYANGERYQGLWRHGQRSGKGRLEYPDGERYVGEFRNNLRHGVGVLTVGGQRTHGIFKHDRPANPPPYAQDEDEDGEFDDPAPPREIPFDWRLSEEDPEIEEERDMMAGQVDLDGRFLRKDGPFPMGVADTYPGGPASTLMGITESDLHLSLCARRQPRFLDTVYDLFSSGDFFSH